MAVCGVAAASLGTYCTQIEPFWPQFHEMTMPVARLPASFEGYRIAQLTDLHVGRTPFAYVQSVIERTRAMKPDLVVVTGDLTHHNAAWAEPVSKLLGTFSVPVLVSYGNHEYGIERDDQTGDSRLPQKLERDLKAAGCVVLRNRATTIDHADGRLWFVGLDDLWWGEFLPAKAFAGVPRNEAVIALSHNPDTAADVDAYAPSLMLAGHTHGGQVRLPFIGALYLNIRNDKLDQGLFHLRNCTLYVCRGVGYIHRVRFYCRPEVVVFNLSRDAGPGSASGLA